MKTDGKVDNEANSEKKRKRRLTEKAEEKWGEEGEGVMGENL